MTLSMVDVKSPAVPGLAAYLILFGIAIASFLLSITVIVHFTLFYKSLQRQQQRRVARF